MSAAAPRTREDVTGLVLAGGQGARMGGLDKGLQDWQGRPLAQHALERLRPQVGPLLVSANRHPDVYAGFGAPVLADAQAGHPGPLAGLAAGLAACATPWLLAVPCDAPLFPPDLAARLARAAQQTGAPMAIARAPDAQGRLRSQPVFCLLRPSLLPKLLLFLEHGGHKVGQWCAAQQAAHADFDAPGDDPQAFANVNTMEELRALHALQHRSHDAV